MVLKGRTVEFFGVIMSLIEIQGFAASKLLEKHSKETLDTLIVRLPPYDIPIYYQYGNDVVSNRTTENPVLAFGNPFVPSGSPRDLIYRVQDPLVQKKSMYGRGGRLVKFKKLRMGTSDFRRINCFKTTWFFIHTAYGQCDGIIRLSWVISCSYNRMGNCSFRLWAFEERSRLQKRLYH